MRSSRAPTCRFDRSFQRSSADSSARPPIQSDLPDVATSRPAKRIEGAGALIHSETPVESASTRVNERYRPASKRTPSIWRAVRSKAKGVHPQIDIATFKKRSVHEEPHPPELTRRLHGRAPSVTHAALKARDLALVLGRPKVAIRSATSSEIGEALRSLLPDLGLR